MTETHDSWIALSERGEWRGADEIAARAHEELLNSNNGQQPVVSTIRNLEPLAVSSTVPKWRLLSGPVVAAAVFVAVILTMTVSLLLAGARQSSNTGTVAPGGTGTVPVPGVEASEAPAPDALGLVPVIPDTFQPVNAWPSPVLDPVFALGGCPTQPGSPGWFIPDSFFDFLGLDRQTVNLAAVEPTQIAESNPMLRAGSSSMVSLEDIEGGCVLAVADGTTSGWAVFLSNGEPAMVALSTPRPNEFEWDTVSTTPGEYQQWRIATDQHFNGTVSDDGQVHAVTNERHFIATFDPALVPDPGRVGGWLMSSLAVSPTTANQLLEGIETDSILRTALPNTLPPGFGICARTMAFLLEDTPDGPGEENQQLILCNTAGAEITITAGTLTAAPSDSVITVINGHDMTEWPTNGQNTLQFSRSGLDIRIQGPPAIEAETLRAIVISMPLATPPPPPPVDAAARIGIAEGIDPETSSIIDPDIDLDETTLPDWIASVHAGEAEVTLSDSMQAIHETALNELDATPYTYNYEERDSFTIEGASFDVPDLHAWIRISQQELPIDSYDGNPISHLDDTWGAWQIRTKQDTRRIQIVAYSPSIERQINILFTQGLYEEPFAITVSEAQQVAHDILDAIAKPQ